MLHKMRSLIDIDPDKARTELVRAFRESGCHNQIAAEIVGCKAHTFIRWARLLGIKDELDALKSAYLKSENRVRHINRGGAGYHVDPAARAAKAAATREAKKRAAAVPATEATTAAQGE